MTQEHIRTTLKLRYWQIPPFLPLLIRPSPVRLRCHHQLHRRHTRRSPLPPILDGKSGRLATSMGTGTGKGVTVPVLKEVLKRAYVVLGILGRGRKKDTKAALVAEVAEKRRKLERRGGLKPTGWETDKMWWFFLWRKGGGLECPMMDMDGAPAVEQAAANKGTKRPREEEDEEQSVDATMPDTRRRRVEKKEEELLEMDLAGELEAPLVEISEEEDDFDALVDAALAAMDAPLVGPSTSAEEDHPGDPTLDALRSGPGIAPATIESVESPPDDIKRDDLFEDLDAPPEGLESSELIFGED
ncbi:hypothetical protein BZA05DRAFT_449122 [Tricharina praecox]|uniref:uncharacterized protein n=1 Tax=Tricharina praecox TaxID=43433 RepID=UPI00222124DB|nr:uncharacterized protein BZA05DRAFT_449122 [Tricharina praecox]KAI5842342.1 hypothetical protein BZA05DRAFT_449122 [Tricharina praecox]